MEFAADRKVDTGWDGVVADCVRWHAGMDEVLKSIVRSKVREGRPVVKCHGYGYRVRGTWLDHEGRWEVIIVRDLCMISRPNLKNEIISNGQTFCYTFVKIADV